MVTWRALIPELLSTGSYRTQLELVQALADQGHHVDQAAISRELRVLGVTKVEGEYHLPVGAFDQDIHRFEVTSQGCLVVVVTEPACAMALALQIDRARVDGVLGTVAGDDTVFVATTGSQATERFAAWLRTRHR